VEVKSICGETTRVGCPARRAQEKTMDKKIWCHGVTSAEKLESIAASLLNSEALLRARSAGIVIPSELEPYLTIGEGRLVVSVLLADPKNIGEWRYPTLPELLEEKWDDYLCEVDIGDVLRSEWFIRDGYLFLRGWAHGNFGAEPPGE